MEVLIAPVGDQDPVSSQTGEMGSVLTLTEHIHPSRIFLLPTLHSSGDRGRDTHQQAIDTSAALRERHAALSEEAITILPLPVDNPTDYTQVLQALDAAAGQVREALAQVGGSVTLHVSAASGTPTIKTGMILLVSSGTLSWPGLEPARLYQVANPLFASTERVSTIDVTIIEAARLIDHACSLLQQEALDATRVDLQRLAEVARSPQRRMLAATLDAYVAALQLHQRLAFGAARQALSDLQGNALRREQLKGLADVIKRQRAALQKLVDGDRRALLHDLLLNAERQQRRGEYADALARSWRIIDETLRERLCDKHGIDVDEDRRLSTEQVSRFSAVQGVLDGARLRQNLYVGQLIDVLDALGDGDVSQALDISLDRGLRQQVDASLRERIKGGPPRLRHDLFRDFSLDHRWRKDRKPATPVEERTVVQAVIAKLAQPGSSPITTYRDLRRWVNNVRNHSVVAHGTLDIGKDDGGAAIALARQIMSATIGLPEASHPFSRQTHESVVTQVRDALIGT